MLIRLPNLVVLALTQYFVRYGVLMPVYASKGLELQMSHLNFALLVFSSLLLAAGGYIINDYYDVEMDKINRPSKVIVGKFISLKTAGFLHYALTIPACALGIWLAYAAGNIKLGFIHIVIALVLFYYSIKYKRIPFAGNITVALLAALSVGIVWLFEFFSLKQNYIAFAEFLGNFGTINIFVIAYAIFALWVSLIREMVKDVEDIQGDETVGCRTLPIVLGLEKIKKIILALSVVFLVMIAGATYILFAWQYYACGWFMAVAIGGLCLYYLMALLKAKTVNDYHFLSNLLKIIMVAGVLSMQVLNISF